MKKSNVIMWGIFLASFWLLYIFQIGKSVALCWYDTEMTVGMKVSATGSLYQEADVLQREWINLYGLSQNILQKRFIEDFTLYKTGYGKIVEPRRAASEEEILAAVDNIEVVVNYLRDRHIPVYYITSLLPITNTKDLPREIEDASHENAQKLLEELNAREIPMIDLREKDLIRNIPKEELFYRTDHHWSMDTCFRAYQEIIWQLEEELQQDLDLEGYYTDINNYDRYQKENCFLGSYGVKVGEFYAGMDDYVVYFPKFQTSFQFEGYKDHVLQLEKNGGFQEALMDMSYVDDKDFYNKYSAFSNGRYYENRVVNFYAPNQLKVLFISHSYGRPLTQYLALCFGEVRNLDPQEGRYNDNYLEYIDEYEPDLVLILTEFEGEGSIPISVG